jgi:hypothetical protein
MPVILLKFKKSQLKIKNIYVFNKAQQHSKLVCLKLYLLRKWLLWTMEELAPLPMHLQ